MKKILKLTAVPLLLGGLLIAPANLQTSCGCSSSCGVTSAHASDVHTAHLALKGLACATCKYAVRAALNDLDGVERTDVDYAKRRATVLYDPNKVSPKQMVEAIEKAGFQAEVEPEK
ncbi:MAG: hypothetical protein Tsb0017_28690 [Geothermobacteraceae bacterium]